MKTNPAQPRGRGRQLPAPARRALAASMLALGCVLPAAGAPAVRADDGADSVAIDAAAADPLQVGIDRLLRLGFDRPDDALAGLKAIDAGDRASRAERIALLQARASVLAQSGRADDAGIWIDALNALGDPRARAGAQVARAQLARTAGRLDLAEPLAQSALAMLRAACPAMPAGEPDRADAGVKADPRAAHECNVRAAWDATQILQRYWQAKGAPANAAAQAQLGRELALWAADSDRLAISSADLAWRLVRSDKLDAAQPLLRQAQRLAVRSGDPALQAQVRMAQARIANRRDDTDSVRRLADEALPLARQALSPRLEAELLTFLSDLHVKQGRPADALRAVERALPIARRHHDMAIDLVLTNNAGLAKIGLGRIAEGKQDLARVEQLASDAGLTALRAEVLREYDAALAAAGDLRGALELYHRERELNAQTMDLARDAALKQLRQRNDRERKQRDIDLLARDNELKSAEIANRDLMLRIWAVAGVVLALSAATVLLLYRRVRATNRELVASEAQLRVQSERDPLTNLANRRQFLSVMHAEQARGGAEAGFEGALLLVDIDHFKHVNDGHGHAAGDLVLCEVAKRLNEAVRGDDLVVRWGGEEFLVLALKVPAAQAEQLAERVLKVIGERPVIVDGRPVAVTVSIGYARFPLPPHVLPLGWEQAINLTDMALYTAKSQGRNKSVGIVAADAPAEPALKNIEADFERAWQDGRVTLKIAPGPLALAA
ncbi:MAG: diguanylate cyclase [Burkholderiaceae bacterium]|nr:diguanylate cyclase [Burkholderiaceae bacterium]